MRDIAEDAEDIHVDHCEMLCALWSYCIMYKVFWGILKFKVGFGLQLQVHAKRWENDESALLSDSTGRQSSMSPTVSVVPVVVGGCSETYNDASLNVAVSQPARRT